MVRLPKDAQKWNEMKVNIPGIGREKSRIEQATYGPKDICFNILILYAIRF